MKEIKELTPMQAKFALYLIGAYNGTAQLANHDAVPALNKEFDNNVISHSIIEKAIEIAGTEPFLSRHHYKTMMDNVYFRKRFLEQRKEMRALMRRCEELEQALKQAEES